MWVNGIAQGLMWRAVNSDGTLTYSFVETLVASHPGFIVRFVGGAIFLSGMFLMAWNLGAPYVHRPPRPPLPTPSWPEETCLMKHEVIEKNVGLLALLMVFAVSIGGLTQIVPLFFQD
ncbi:hypothetical protein PpSQ1_26570, partial [Pseudomonas putida]